MVCKKDGSHVMAIKDVHLAFSINDTIIRSLHINTSYKHIKKGPGKSGPSFASMLCRDNSPRRMLIRDA